MNGHVYPEVDKQHLGSNYEEPRILYHNNGNGTFSEISAERRARDDHAQFFARPGHRRFLERWQLSAVVSNMNAPPAC